MARDRKSFEDVCDFFRTEGIDLYLADLGRRVNWKSDDTYLAALALVQSVEGRAIKERTHGAIIRRFLLAGRGWPASVRFGTMRDETFFLVEDTEQMAVVHWLVARFLQMSRDGDGSLRRLRAELREEQGYTLSHERIRTILTDPLYVTGEWFVTYAGYAVECKRVGFSHPVSPEDHQLVGEYLSLRGKSNTTTPLGHSLANYVPFFCEGCRNEEVGERGYTPMLRCFLNKSRPNAAEVYRHTSHAGAPAGCADFVPPLRHDVDRALVRVLVRLVRSKSFLKAATEASRRRHTEETGSDLAGELQEAAGRKARLEEALGKRKDEALARLLDGALGDAAYVKVCERLEAELVKAARRLEHLERRHEREQVRKTSRGQVERSLADQRLVDLFESILTEDVPEDPDARVVRAALVRALVSHLVLVRKGEGYVLEVYGPLFDEPSTQELRPERTAEVRALLNVYRRQGPAAVAETQVGVLNGAMSAPGNLDEDERHDAECVNQGHTKLTHSQAETLVERLRRDERLPRDFASARVPPARRRMMSYADAAHGGVASWVATSDAIARERLGAGTWQLDQVRAALERATADLGAGVSLAGREYADLAAANRGVPTRTFVNTVARRHGTTAAALRREAMLRVHGCGDGALQGQRRASA